MARDGIPFANQLVRGALVQLIEDIILPIPNIVIFQYNPESITRTLTPHNPLENGGEGRGNQAPDSQPFIPQEKIAFVLELSAAEGVSVHNPMTAITGVASRLAALRKMVLPTNGLLSDIKGSAMALAAASEGTLDRRSVPITFFLYGPGLIVPVRITGFSVEEVLHTPLLYPYEAKISLDMSIITPDQFRCPKVKYKDIAISAYNWTKLHEDSLAQLNLTNSVEEILSVIL